MYEKHGRTKSPLYKLWMNIKDRCKNPKNPYFHNYGGRGITLCDEWKYSFSAFENHIGERPSKYHTIDRIDNDKGYFPGNIKWSTKKDQARNMRKNNLITFNGKTQCVAAWADELGKAPSTIWYRVYTAKMPLEKALSEEYLYASS